MIPMYLKVLIMCSDSNLPFTKFYMVPKRFKKAAGKPQPQFFKSISECLEKQNENSNKSYSTSR